MKKVIVFLLASTLFISCYSRDDDYNVKTVNLFVPNLIEYEAQTSYNINEYAYFDVSFSRYLPEQGYSDLLDILKTTNSDKFFVNFSLYKKDLYGNYNYLNFNNFYILEKGELNSSYYGAGFAVLNSATNKYEFRIGIQLLEAGEYRIRVDPNFTPLNKDNSSFFNTINLNIETTSNLSSDININNEYDFTVN